MADRTIEIIIDVNDRTNGKVQSLQKQLEAAERKAQQLANKFKALSTQRYRMSLELIDRVTAPASRLNNLLRGIANRAWRISFSLADNALGGIKKIESALLRITSKAYPIMLNVKGAAMNKLNGLLSGAALAGGVMMPFGAMAGVGFGITNAIQATADFEKAMSRVQAIRQLDKSSEEMQQLTAQAKELGKTTAWTRTQVAEAQYFQSLAGWETPQILATTPHLLNMASATDTPLQRTADIVTDLMTAYNLKPTDTYINSKGERVNVAQEFIDTMTKMQAVSNTNVEQAYQAGKYSANQFGALSMHLSGQEQVQAAMENFRDAQVMTALLANAGIKESMSGTGMSTILQRMASGNRNALFGLGFTDTQIEDLQHNILPLEQIVKQLSHAFHNGLDINKVADFMEELDGIKLHADTRRRLDKLSRDVLENGGKLGSADRMQLATMLGGAEHSHKLMALMMGDWDAMKKKLTDVNGTAADMSNVMLDNLAGSFTMLGAAWDNFQQNLMESPAGGLRDFVDALTELINHADNLFKDGIQFKDIFSLIGDAVSRLKNKFLELDGIGSVLAGGALIGGLMKIASTARGVMNTIRGVNGINRGVSAGQSVGSMNITAGVVNVNGRIAGGVGRRIGNQSIIDNYNRTRERIRGGTPPPAPSTFGGVKSAAGYAAAFSAIFGVMDIMNTKAYNAERLANAAPSERAQIVKENRQAEWETGGGVAGSIAGSALGAALGSVAGPIGIAIGGVIGGFLGDYLGRFLGKEAAKREDTPQTKGWRHGDEPSDEVSRKVQDGLNGLRIKTAYEELRGIAEAQARRRKADKAELDAIHAQQRATQETLQERRNFDAHFKENMGYNFYDTPFNRNNDATLDYYRQKATETPVIQPPDIFSHAEAGTPTEAQLATEGQVPIELPQVDTTTWLEEIQAQISDGLSNISTAVTETFSSIGETAGAAFSTLSESASTAFSTLSEIASSALEGVTTAFSTAKETVQSVWSEVPGFFSSVLSGLGSAAAAAGSAIYSGLTSVIDSIIGAWSSGAATIMGIISSISAAAASAGASVGAKISGVIAGVRGHAEGGFVTSPELALIGEAGPELILPLNDSARTNDLLNQSGLLNQSEGGTFNFGGMTINFNITGDNPQNIMAEIQDNLEDLTEKIAAQLSDKVSDSFYNRALN